MEGLNQTSFEKARLRFELGTGSEVKKSDEELSAAPSSWGAKRRSQLSGYEEFDKGTPHLEVLGGEVPLYASNSSSDFGVLVGGSEKNDADEVGLCKTVSNEAFGGKSNDGSSTYSLEVPVTTDDAAPIGVTEIGGIRVHGKEVVEMGRRQGIRAKHGRGEALSEIGNLHDPINVVERKKGLKIVYSRGEMEELRFVNVRGQRKMGEALSEIGNLHDLINVDGRKKGLKIVYSRGEMEELRFVNVRGQRKMWHGVYSELAPDTRRKYDELANFRNGKHRDHVACDPYQAVGRRNSIPSILGDLCSRNMNHDVETVEVNSIDDFCDDNGSKDNSYAIGGCSEEDDEASNDDDYECIKRPAFLVEGEPNFDSGPPEDGLEYLRRVRWEASQMPNVKVAKLDNRKFRKERSVYMPQIPDIETCPLHLAPSKQWEDEFLADFSELRLALSSLETPGNSESSSKLEFREVDVPTLSTVLGVDLATRVRMLRRRIHLFEQAEASRLSKNDSMWLFALCATVDTPLDADTCAALRSLLRKCANVLGSRSELDDEVVMLNILATISGKYFGQSENR